MLDYKKITEEILDYYRFNRGVGHTSAQLGKYPIEDAIFVVTNERQRHWIMDNFEKHPKEIITLSNIENHRLKGTSKPLIIDHFALQVLLTEVLRSQQEKEQNWAEVWKETVAKRSTFWQRLKYLFTKKL